MTGKYTGSETIGKESTTLLWLGSWCFGAMEKIIPIPVTGEGIALLLINSEKLI